MRTALALLILGLTASSIMCTCPSTIPPIASGAGFTLAASTAVTAATKCGFDTTASSEDKLCVAQADVDTKVEAFIADLIENLENAAEQRDQYIVDQRGEVIKLLDSLRRINEITDGSTSGIDIFAGDFVQSAGYIADNFTAFVEDFNDYRKKRATCFEALIKSQVGVLCTSLLDEADYPPNFVIASLAFSDTFAGELSTACFPYFESSQEQSSTLLVSLYKSVIPSVADYLDKIKNQDVAGAVTALATLVTESAKVTQPTGTNKYQQATELADGCTSTTTCATWTESLFALGILNQDKAILGGADRVPVFSARILSEGNERRLANNGWATTLAAWNAFTVEFSDTPGNVDNTKNANSALRNGIVACAVAALALVF